MFSTSGNVLEWKYWLKLSVLMFIYIISMQLCILLREAAKKIFWSFFSGPATQRGVGVRP